MHLSLTSQQYTGTYICIYTYEPYMLLASSILNQQEAFISIVSAQYVYNRHCPCYICIHITRPIKYFPAVNSSSPNAADVTISLTMFPLSSLLLVGTVLYLVMFSVTAFSGSGWFRGRDRVTEPLAWLMARGWTACAVKLATCTTSTINCVPLSGVAGTVGLSLRGLIQTRCCHIAVPLQSSPW